jgi:hypothetical protein
MATVNTNRHRIYLQIVLKSIWGITETLIADRDHGKNVVVTSKSNSYHAHSVVVEKEDNISGIVGSTVVVAGHCLESREQLAFTFFEFE